jgi:hypothetical protein
MIIESLMSDHLREDERWEKVLARFAAIETQLQELYWEVLECMGEDAPPQSNQ